MPSRREPSQLLRWQRSSSSVLTRQLEIFGVMLQFFSFLAWDKLVGNRSSRRKHYRAKWLVKQLLILGPTFIKIGQSLSTRADLIPLEYTQELSQLQDRVPSFDTLEALAVIESELGKPIDKLFQTFDSIPLASASLGQVHRATLYTGEDIVVKVQRPGLEKILNLDFAVLHQLVRLANRFFVTLKKYELKAIYEGFFELLFQEIDYIHEGKNAERFRENFQGYPLVKTPTVFWLYTTKKVLCLEYLPGIKIDDREALEASGINLDKIIETGICSYLKQLLLDGFFQSDPHPGNMAVTPRGELIFYDFGTMAEVKLVAKEQMIETFFAVLRKDTNKIVETLVYMGLIEPIKDMTSVKRIVSFLLENFRNKPVDIKAFEQIGDEVYLMFKQQPFRLPPQMTFILKSLTTLDGIARALDPQYNLLAASQPFVRNLAISTNKGNLLGTVAKQTRSFIQNQWRKPRGSEQLIQHLEARIERGELQLRVRSLENERTLKRIYLAIKSLIYACLTGFSLLSASILLSTPLIKFAIVGFGSAGLFSLFLLRSLIALIMQEKLDKMAEK